MVMPLMSQTLPTIVGMGVVSRTTEVMFNKHGRRIKGIKSKTKSKGRTVKIYRGSRGGTYVIRHGKKIYI